MNHDDLDNDLLQGWFDAAPATLHRWLPQATLRQLLQQQLDKELSRCEDLDFAKRFAHFAPVPGVAPERYLQRVLSVGDGRHALIGLRRHGLEGFFFVDVLATTHPLNTSEHLNDALHAALNHYRGFSPRCARLLRAADAPLPPLPHHQLGEDQVLVAAPARDLPPASPDSPLSLDVVQDLDAAAAFVATHYEALFEAAPHLSQMLHPAQRDELVECRDTGHLVWLSHPRWGRCGLLATAHADGPSITGQCVIEEIVAEVARGHRLASTAQRLLAPRIEAATPGALLWGTIDCRNTASRKAASRAGRVELATWRWLTPCP